MRARIPVQSAGRRRRSSRSLFRNKSPAAAAEVDPVPVPVLLLQDMSLCYRLLRQLVPGLPPGRAASRVEILQHAIDYILDLQTELDSEEPQRCDRHRQRPQSDQSSGVTQSTDVSDVSTEDSEDERSWTLLR